MKKLFLFVLCISLGRLSGQVCYSTAVTYTIPAGANPRALAGADFNGDGFADIAVTLQDSNKVGIYFGDGSGNFGTFSWYSTGGNPVAITSADFNADSKADLVTANYGGNSFSVLLGDGSGGFSSIMTYTAGSNPMGVTTDDFNNDGKPDLAIANYVSNDVSILLGSGTGTFSTPVNYPVGTGAVASISKDLDSDGNKDLVVLNYNSYNISVLMGTGTGTFGTATNFAVTTVGSGYYPDAITSVDFNADGKFDLGIACNSANFICVLLGTGTGSTFGSATNYTTNGGSTFSEAIVHNDFNGDSKIDLATVNGSTNDISVFLGDGTGNFSTAINFPTGGAIPYGLMGSQDFNGDSRPDLVVANVVSGSNNLSVLLNSPIVVNAGPDLTVCANTVANLSGTSSTLSGMWTSGGSGSYSPNSTTLNASYAPSSADVSAGSIALILTSTGNGSCPASTDTLIITITPAPTVNAGADQSLCENVNAPVGLNGSSSTSSGIWTSSGTGTFSPDNLTMNAMYYLSSADLLAGNVVLVLTSAANGTCNAEKDTMVIIVNPAPVAAMVASPSVVCINSAMNFSDASTISGGIIASWLWNFGDGNTSTLANPSNVYSTSGTYTVSLVAASSAGCNDTTFFVAVANATPAITTTPNDITCNGLCNGSTSAVPTGAAPFTYLWSTGATTAGITNLCPGNYTVTVTDANGCSDSVWGPITQPSALMASIGSFTPALCAGVDNGIAVENSSGGTGPYNYLWMPSGETTPTATNLATGTVSLTVTDQQGCTNATAMFLTASTAVTATISGPATLCQGQSGQLTYTTSGGTAPYMPDWFDYVTWGSFSMGDTALLTPLQPFYGQDTVKLTLTDNSGCLAYAYKYIQVGYGDSLSGLVSDTGLIPVHSGEVYLFQQKTNHVGLYDTLTSTIINPNGTYSLPNIPYGDYFLKVVADTSAGYYPGSVGTYYSNKPNAYQWDSALVINHHTCTASNINGYTVTIIEIPAAPSGPGIISGYITLTPSFGQRLSGGHNSVMGAPLKGVDIKLGKNPGGTPAARTTPDTTSGFYSFTNVPVGSYRIYVDIPNYGMDSVLTINISGTNTVSTQNNYYVDSVMIRVDSVQYIGLSQFSDIPAGVSVYPNPSAGIIQIEAQEQNGKQNSVYDLQVVNVLGAQVFRSKLNAGISKIDLRHLPDGNYLLHVISSGGISTKKISIQK